MRFTRRHITLRRNVERLTSHLARARFFRGHGVHSPFVYALVREVFMRRTLLDGDTELYARLLEHGLSDERAIQLHNLYHHCGYGSFGIDRAAEAELEVLTVAFPAERIAEAAARARKTRQTLCIMQPYASRERLALCRRLVEEHPGTSVDNRAYLLLFNNHLPKQHFKI